MFLKHYSSYFQKIKGTPKFWQAARNELLAMIEALGPFNCFSTLSCAEKRWHEVVVAILEKEGHEITELCGNYICNSKSHLYVMIFKIFIFLQAFGKW